MIYVGPVPRHVWGTDEMPESIDPALKVNYANPDRVGHGMSYWPAYHAISPANRGGYLSWLAGGRKAPDAYIGYVFLFFYGLERRVLIDASSDSSARADLRRIYAEVLRLQRLYGGNRSFNGYATKFQQCLELMLTAEGESSSVTPPDPATAVRYPTPVALQLGLGMLARDGQPVPAEWALSWALLHPEIYPRTPAARCPEEFRKLFQERYRRRHGVGLRIRPSKQLVSLSYRPASGGLGTTQVGLDVPDVVAEPAATRELADLVDECTAALDAYSRLIGKQPDVANSLAAAALLPAELLSTSGEALRPVRELIDRTLGDAEAPVVVPAADLVALWPARTPGKFGKVDAVGLAQLLERLGVGVEPDVRMGGPVLSSGPAVLFRLGQEQPAVASHEYAAATTLLHLAAVVSAADDEVSEAERAHLTGHLETGLHLSAGERQRLSAHLTLLLASETKLTGLKKRLSVLTAAQRGHVADFLTMVAAIDGHISPGEVKTLRKIYTLLELDPESVYGRLHVSAAAKPAPATEPVTIGTPGPKPTGYLIPQPQPAATGQLVLDRELVEARLAETAAVSALLADIFVDEADDPAPPPAAVAIDVPSVRGLDAAHSTFARRVADSPRWTRSDLEALCDELGLMLEGALDSVNEAALDAVDEPLVEDDHDEFRINDYARGALLA
ncbi:hypothetical protein ADL03_16680 [Nocardia sp. NRRL S-836]|nr:hypothetical protein ADL03_16680 [Nocardia sp. NRRL S-836]